MFVLLSISVGGGGRCVSLDKAGDEDEVMPEDID
jgi:hypothetical protein